MFSHSMYGVLSSLSSVTIDLISIKPFTKVRRSTGHMDIVDMDMVKMDMVDMVDMVMVDMVSMNNNKKDNDYGSGSNDNGSRSDKQQQ